MSTNSNSQTNTWIFSVIGVLLVAILLIFVNWTFSKSRLKIDATEHNLFTLTEGTKNLLGELEEKLKKFDSDGEKGQLTMRLYVTRDKDMMPPVLSDYADKIEALLREFQAHSDGRLRLEAIEPKPYSEEENTANQNGVPPFPLSESMQVYLGLSVSALDKKASVPFFHPANEPLLEYDIARAISEVTTTDKPKVGLMTSYEVNGGLPGAPGAPGGGQAWYFRNKMGSEFDVQEVPMGADKIDQGLNVLVVVHPAGIDEGTQYAIDQYLLGGGTVMALLDPFSRHNRESASQPQRIPGMPAPNQPVTSDLDALMRAWGIEFESVNVVLDRRYIGSTPRQNGMRVRDPMVVGVPAAGISNDNAATRQIQYVELPMPGAFYEMSSGLAEGLEKEVLLSTSENAGTLSPHILFGDPQTAQTAYNNMRANSKPMELAISLTGKFKTAFKNGNPEDEDGEVAEGGDEKEEGEDAKKAEADGGHIAEAEKPGRVILIGDTDLVTDANAPGVGRLISGEMIEMRPPNGNMAFFFNLISYLGGDPNLIEVRSRGDNTRPFTRYEELTQETAKDSQEELNALLKKRQSAERDWRAARAKEERGEQLTDEERQIVKTYDDERVASGKRIVELQRELRKGIDRLEAKWKWINIALIPSIVALGAIAHLMVRRFSTSAR